MKNNNVIKVIGLSVFFIISLMFIVTVIVKFVDNMKFRNMLFIISWVVLILLSVILLKAPKVVCWTVGSLWGIIIFIGMIVSIVSSVREPSKTVEIVTTFHGNNSFTQFYSDGIGAKGYDDINSILDEEIENRKKTRKLGDDELKEIYRMQIGEKIFVYFKEDEEIVEYDYFQQDDLYYRSGVKSLSYNGVGSSDSYTAEETIRKDIANTMWRGVGNKEVGAPAWGVSADENIFSMSINDEPVDDVILINELDGKKYYFWITTHIEGIETIDDVKAAEIVMKW